MYVLKYIKKLFQYNYVSGNTHTHIMQYNYVSRNIYIIQYSYVSRNIIMPILSQKFSFFGKDLDITTCKATSTKIRHLLIPIPENAGR